MELKNLSGVALANRVTRIATYRLRSALWCDWHSDCRSGASIGRSSQLRGPCSDLWLGSFRSGHPIGWQRWSSIPIPDSSFGYCCCHRPNREWQFSFCFLWLRCYSEVMSRQTDWNLGWHCWAKRADSDSSSLQRPLS